MRYFSILLIFISSSFITFPSYTSSGNYIVYETGLVVPSGSENITFNFTGIDIENEIEEMVEFRENLFNSKK